MNELTQEALVAASVDRVWHDFTDPTALAQWMWPPRLETTAVVEPGDSGRVGGSIRGRRELLAVIGRGDVAEPAAGTEAVVAMGR